VEARSWRISSAVASGLIPSEDLRGRIGTRLAVVQSHCCRESTWQDTGPTIRGFNVKIYGGVRVGPCSSECPEWTGGWAFKHIKARPEVEIR
jgi:hypothetical protein